MPTVPKVVRQSVVSISSRASPEPARLSVVATTAPSGNVTCVAASVSRGRRGRACQRRVGPAPVQSDDGQRTHANAPSAVLFVRILPVRPAGRDSAWGASERCRGWPAQIVPAESAHRMHLRQPSDDADAGSTISGHAPTGRRSDPSVTLALDELRLLGSSPILLAAYRASPAEREAR